MYRTLTHTWLILPSSCTNCSRTKWGVKGGGSRVSGGVISDDYPSMCCIGERMWGGGVSDNRSPSVQFRRRNAGSATGGGGGGVFLRRAWHCSSPPRPVIWLGPSCHLCAAVARPSLAGYRLEPPPPAPALPANRISSRRHCIPATLKRIRFSRCENDAFLPRALPPRTGRPRATPRGATQDRPTLSLHSYHITTPSLTPPRRPRQASSTHHNWRYHIK